MAQFCQSMKEASVESFWKAHALVNDAFGLFRDETAGNSPLHMLTLATARLAHSNGSSGAHDLKFSISVVYPPPPWSAAAIGLLYRLVVIGKCSVNSQNWVGNTALHLACLRPKAGLLVRHLIRLGADPKLKNQLGLQVNYDPVSHRGWLVKGLPSLKCGIWDAIHREDSAAVGRYLSMWCRTVASQPNGQSMFEAAMATGSFELVRQIDRARTTNELVAASIALDVDYVQELLGARIERDKCDLETKDRGQDPPRSLIAELRLTLGEWGDGMCDLLRSRGVPHEQLYFDELEREQDAFDQCPFVRAVSKAITREELDTSWALMDEPGFKASRYRRQDHAGYLHFLVEQYLASSSNPMLQRGLVRLMFKVALAGVDIQARDDLGRTALTLAAHSIVNTSTTSLEETALIARFPGPSLSEIESVDVKNEKERAEQTNTQLVVNYENNTQFERIPDSTNDALEDKTNSEQGSMVMGEKGVDSSIGNSKNECVHREFYVPRDCFALRPRNSRVLHVDLERSGCVAAMEGLPGIWPVLDDMIRAITNGQSMSVCESLLSQIRHCLQNNLVHVRSTRCGLETVELAKAAIPRHLHRHSLFTQSSPASCDRCTPQTETDDGRTPGQKLIQLLQSYVGISDFAMAAMAGDLARMKCCLALGDSARKVKSYFGRYYNGVDPANLRAMFVARPLIVSVMDYSTTEAVELMLTYGADLTEFYSASQPPGPVAFWAFQETVPLQTTLKVVKTAPLDIRDAHGGTMLHRAVRIFHQLNKVDHNGHLWASLILLVLLNRGVRVELRDCWARTARDVAVSRRRSIADQCTNINGLSLHFRNVEHQ
ncbi:uncharacterized protein DEA37_0001724, partial [Paragonimus westermani]